MFMKDLNDLSLAYLNMVRHQNIMACPVFNDLNRRYNGVYHSMGLPNIVVRFIHLVNYKLYISVMQSHFMKCNPKPDALLLFNSFLFFNLKTILSSGLSVSDCFFMVLKLMPVIVTTLSALGLCYDCFQFFRSFSRVL